MTKSAIRAMSEDSKAMEEHLQLWTIVPSKQLRRNQAGKLDIRHANFSVVSKTDGMPIPGDYEKGITTLADFIDNFVEQYEEELGDDPHEQVKSAIKQAFEDARTELKSQAKRLNDAGYDEELLDAIQTVKVYPKCTKDGVKSNYINKYYGRAHTAL